MLFTPPKLFLQLTVNIFSTKMQEVDSKQTTYYGKYKYMHLLLTIFESQKLKHRVYNTNNNS